MSLLLENPVAVAQAKDIRSQAVDKRRAKERRVKYRYTNANLIGTPVAPYIASFYAVKNPEMWNKRNAWKMQDNMHRRCRSSCCLAPGDSASTITRGHMADDTKPLAISKKYRPSPNRRDPNDVDDGIADEELVLQTEVATQLALSHAVSAAVEKFETKELNNLVKNEYEVIGTPSIDIDDFVFV